MDIQISADLWASAMLPEGILERWLVADGAAVRTGEAVAEVRVEDALHDLTAPGAGRLVHAASPNDVVAPGAVIGRVDTP